MNYAADPARQWHAFSEINLILMANATRHHLRHDGDKWRRCCHLHIMRPDDAKPLHYLPAYVLCLFVYVCVSSCSFAGVPLLV